MSNTAGASSAPDVSSSEKPDAIRDAWRTIQRLEPDIVALDPNLLLTSLSVSMKRIADSLSTIQSELTMNRNQVRTDTDRVVNAITGLGNNISSITSIAYQLREDWKKS